MNGRELVQKWKAYVLHVRAIRSTALELMCHPDATREQVWDVHLKLADLMKRHREMVPKVRKAWPAFREFVELEEK